jgi:hypothetical protein
LREELHVSPVLTIVRRPLVAWQRFPTRALDQLVGALAVTQLGDAKRGCDLADLLPALVDRGQHGLELDAHALRHLPRALELRLGQDDANSSPP